LLTNYGVHPFFTIQHMTLREKVLELKTPWSFDDKIKTLSFPSCGPSAREWFGFGALRVIPGGEQFDRVALTGRLGWMVISSLEDAGRDFGCALRERLTAKQGINARITRACLRKHRHSGCHGQVIANKFHMYRILTVGDDAALSGRPCLDAESTGRSKVWMGAFRRKVAAINDHSSDNNLKPCLWMGGNFLCTLANNFLLVAFHSLLSISVTISLGAVEPSHALRSRERTGPHRTGIHLCLCSVGCEAVCQRLVQHQLGAKPRVDFTTDWLTNELSSVLVGSQFWEERSAEYGSIDGKISLSVM